MRRADGLIERLWRETGVPTLCRFCARWGGRNPERSRRGSEAERQENKKLNRYRQYARAAPKAGGAGLEETGKGDRKSTRLNSSHQIISYAVFCLKKKTK